MTMTMMKKRNFQRWDLTDPMGSTLLWDPDPAADPFGTQVKALWQGAALEAAAGETWFGFVGAGSAELERAGARLRVGEGMYFALPGEGRVRMGGEGWGVVVRRPSYEGLFALGGPVEERGRLRYIDGCTDSLLISPVRWGEPCLNLLHLPPQTRQRAHTHPSVRAGVIVSGQGRCVLPGEEVALRAGLAFVIPAQAQHSFHTDGEALRVIAYHPDSDFGPRDEDHPMINRTIIASAPQP
jgi:hypothetical protein